MRKLIAAFKISLDGKTEGAEGMADWVDAWSEDYGLTSQIDACIIGGGMYPGYEGYWTGLQANPYKPAWITGAPPTDAELEWADFAARTPHYVLSRSIKSVAWPNTSFLRNLGEVAALKEAPGKDIYLMGGARVTASLINAALVDELRLIVHPLIAGEGKPLFGDSMGRRGLELMDVQQREKSLVSMIYRFPADRSARSA